MFNDFAEYFNEFQEREQALMAQHESMLTKSKELERKMRLEVLAQSQ